MNEQSPHTDIVNDWIIGYLTNSLTPEEMQSLQNWLNVSEENRKHFSDMQEVWIAASDEADEQYFDKEQAYQLFLEHTENLVQPSVKRKTLTISPWMYAAAMVVIVFFCGMIAFQSGKRVLRNQLTQITVEAPYGSKTKLYLPDGTLVWLNAGSKMSYAQDFGINERSLNLSGEAYFEVAKDKDKPFIVKTKEQSIEALGTKFNVSAYPTDSLLTTTLLEGSVLLTTQNLLHPMVLKPNEQFVYNKRTRSALLQQVDANRFVSWTTGYYYFPEQSLEAILYRLSHVYGVQFTVKSEALKRRTFTGTFYRGQSIKDIMEIIHLSIPVRYKIDDHHVTISEI